MRRISILRIVHNFSVRKRQLQKVNEERSATTDDWQHNRKYMDGESFDEYIVMWVMCIHPVNSNSQQCALNARWVNKNELNFSYGLTSLARLQSTGWMSFMSFQWACIVLSVDWWMWNNVRSFVSKAMENCRAPAATLTIWKLNGAYLQTYIMNVVWHCKPIIYMAYCLCYSRVSLKAK